MCQGSAISNWELWGGWGAGGLGGILGKSLSYKKEHGAAKVLLKIVKGGSDMRRSKDAHVENTPPSPLDEVCKLGCSLHRKTCE